MWKIINTLQKNKNNRKNEIVIQEGNLKIDDKVVANNFNILFTSYNDNKYRDTEFLENNVLHCDQTICLFKIRKTDIISFMDKLKNSNSSGMNNISNNLLKKCSMELCKPLTYLINLTIDKGIFPDKLKLATVIPLFKKGDINNYDNYRAISLLCSISKLYKLVIKEQLVTFFDLNNILSTSQHGFTKNKSTESALCDFQDRIVNALDKKRYVLGLFIHFPRGYDCSHAQISSEIFL